MRIDLFLHRSGLMRRRTLAQRACEEERIDVDGRSAKSASRVAPGTIIVVRARPFERTWEVIELPMGSVPKKDREQYARLVSETPWEEL